MDDKLFRAARLVMCPNCNAHGKILFSDDTVSVDLNCQEDGFEAVQKARRENRLESFEVPILMEQIRDLLPPKELIRTLGSVVTTLLNTEEETESKKVWPNGRNPLCLN